MPFLGWHLNQICQYWIMKFTTIKGWRLQYTYSKTVLTDSENRIFLANYNSRMDYCRKNIKPTAVLDYSQLHRANAILLFESSLSMCATHTGTKCKIVSLKLCLYIAMQNGAPFAFPPYTKSLLNFVRNRLVHLALTLPFEFVNSYSNRWLLLNLILFSILQYCA